MNKEELIKEIEEVYAHSNKLRELIDDHDYIFLVGNGASNAIASHTAVDYTKQLKKRALAFTDASMLTCYVNDYGGRNAYAEFIKSYRVPKNTLVILISSSGNSENIIEAAKYCESEQIPWVGLSGRTANNKLRKGPWHHQKLNAWVNSMDYGIVECVHQVLLHSIIEVK
jgi:D-sedoheptulose 7-phosphate isomerase